MITKYINKILVAGIVSCGFTTVLTSCDDLIDPALENIQDITEMYNDPTFARGLIDNAVRVLPYESSPQSDVATDDAVSNDNSNSYKKMATGNWSSKSNPVNQWETRYHAIQYCNLFLENIEKVRWDYTSKALNQMHMDLYRGQAYALRALHMFYLLRAHCGMVNGQLMGVPIHLKSESSEDPSSVFDLPRNTFKECIDQIMADFDEALKYVPNQFGDVTGAIPQKYASMGGTDGEYNRAFGDLQRGKIDGYIIRAMKAQVAIFAASPAYQSAGAMTWEQAARYAADYLKLRGGLACVDPTGWKWFTLKDYIKNYKFEDPDPAEVVWRGTVGDSYDMEQNNYPPSLKGNGRVNPTQNLVDAFPAANGYPISSALSNYDPKNPYANRDPRLRTYILINGDVIGAEGKAINTQYDSKTIDGLNKENGKSTTTGYYLRKLLRDDVNLNPASSQRHFGIRIRTTEILLDFAEAANEAQSDPTAKVGGADFSAYDVIKALRYRVHNGEDWADPYLESIKNDQAKMRELIRNERRLELCFENHRFWDLRRWKASITDGAKGVSITNPSSDVTDYKIFDVEGRLYKDYMYYGPIPYSELLKWSNLQQNDGWSN